MQQECKECRSDNLFGAPYCEACGYRFPPGQPTGPKPNRLKGYTIAAGVGLLAAVIREVLRRLT